LLVNVYGADVSKIHEVPCGIDLELFSPIEKDLARDTLHLAADERVVLFVGRIEPLKGIDILIGAAAALHDGRKFRVLVVGGDGSTIDQINELRAQAKKLGVDHHISFVGAVDHSQLPTYYSAADICVVPSYYESFGLVAVESMACGTPVVATHVGGLASTIVDGETGYLVTQRLAAPFADRIGTLMTDNELRAAFGLAGREFVERYRWANVADAVADLYRSFLKEVA
jgi:D-inositol-3-phosphate glycosyltransferase